MIKSIQIRNFRGIKRCLIGNLEQVNILVGKNGAGKSTILEALYLASAWVKPVDDLRAENKLDYVISRRMNRGSWDTTRKILWHKMNTTKPIEICLSINKTTLKFILADIPKKTVWLELPFETDLRYYSYDSREATDRLFRVTGRYSDLDKLVVEKLEGQIKFLEKLTLLDHNLSQYSRELEKKVWSILLANRLDKELVSMIKEEYEPRAEGLTYMPLGNDYTLALQLTDTTVRIDDLGDGAKNAVIYAAVLLTLKDTAILIEEPETHQHPAGLATTLNFILKAAKQRNLQLIITTHNIELIKIIQKLIEKHNLSLKIFYLERTEEGVVNVRELEK